MMAVKNLIQEYTGMMESPHESCNHHESSQATTTCMESHIPANVKFIEEKGSPLSLNASPTLQKFVTKEIMAQDIRNDILNAFPKGKGRCLMFQLNRFV
jgi:hypothetical protein